MIQRAKRRLQEETRERFTSKLEKVVTPEGFECYVDRSSTNDGEDDLFFMSDSDHDGSDDEQTELPLMFFGYTQKKSLKDVTLMAPEFSSQVESGEVDMKEIVSIHRTYAVSIAEDNLRANVIQEIGTVFEEVLCAVERRGCVSSGDEEESFRNKNKIIKQK